MKKVVCTLLPILAIALVLGMTSAVAQNSTDDVYALGYYSGANVTTNPDTTLRVINDGSAGEADLCAAFYVFDNSQELSACCSCDVTADGIISESVNKNLLSNVLTSAVNHAGVIKVLSNSNPGSCTASAKGAGKPTPGIRGWITHIQAGKTATTPQITEVELKDSNATTLEPGDLELECQYLILLGSGHGQCSCTQEDTAW